MRQEVERYASERGLGHVWHSSEPGLGHLTQVELAGAEKDANNDWAWAGLRTRLRRAVLGLTVGVSCTRFDTEPGLVWGES